jgi:hypothetical protein
MASRARGRVAAGAYYHPVFTLPAAAAEHAPARTNSLLACNKLPLDRRFFAPRSDHRKSPRALQLARCTPHNSYTSRLALPPDKLPAVFSTMKQDGFDAMTLLSDAQFFFG